jgi:hypothetical protein
LQTVLPKLVDIVPSKQSSGKELPAKTIPGP